MGSSRDLMDELEEAMEDANAMVTSNVTIPSGPFITPMPYPHTSVMPYPHASVGAQGSNVNKPFSFDINGISPHPHGITSGGLTLSNFNPGKSEFAINTIHGLIRINLDTGDLTFPPGIGRDVAVREFWLGFHEHFKTIDKKKYEQQIAEISRKADEYRNHANDVVKKSIVKKIAEKYGNEKFIMIKPADLIKFIEGA